MASTKGNCADTSPSSEMDSAELGQLFASSFRELQRIAHLQLKRAWQVDTIQTTALVNETFLKLIKKPQLVFDNKQHFFAVCAKAMRQIILNYAEHKSSLKRGGGQEYIVYTGGQLPQALADELDWESLLFLDQALRQLETLDNHLCHLVELRYFFGAKESEMAEITGVSERTIRRDWVKAKSLLAQAMEP